MLFFIKKIKSIPTILHLLAIDETWTIEYCINKKNKKSKKLRMDSLNNSLQITIPSFNRKIIKNLLEKWLKQKAALHFVKLLDKLQKITMLSYKKLSIRGSRARWGSCTEDKALNLNYKLLFLPKELVCYILLHELCHTKEFNHSKNFWHLLAKFEKDTKTLQKQTLTAHKYLPSWVE